MSPLPPVEFSPDNDHLSQWKVNVFDPTLSISEAEDATGLSREILRIWEKRYGFPLPQRDSGGNRRYGADEIAKLQLIKCLLDLGKRPAHLVGLPYETLQTLLRPQVTDHREIAKQNTSELVSEENESKVGSWLALIKEDSPIKLRESLARHLGDIGLRRWIKEVIGPLSEAVGNAWMLGQLAIYQEHLYSSIVEAILLQAIEQIPATNTPTQERVLLSTLPGERHVLGLRMAQAFLKLSGIAHSYLGASTPLPDICKAAQVLECNAVALSISAAADPGDTTRMLTALRQQLPEHINILLGGTGSQRLKLLPTGVRIIQSLESFAEISTSAMPQLSTEARSDPI